MLDTSKIYSSNNCGDFKVINYRNHKNVEVQFLDTGYRCTVQAVHVVSGKIKDKLFPSVYGAGFVGEGVHILNEAGRGTKAYDSWRGMLGRCYCLKIQKRQPSYVGVTVCKEWHNFQTFAKWFYDNYIEGFHVDKDMRQRGVKSKIYSPETCTFISQRDNSIEANAKSYRVRDPEGLIHEVYNMKEFCRKNELINANMSLVCSGKANRHKGWTKV